MRCAPQTACGLGALVALALGSCSSGTETVPVQCIQSPAAITHALVAAPRPVRLGGVPLSRCLARRADAGSVESLGATFVPAAESLGDAARQAPSSRSALELGYLVAATRRGAARTEGIYYELDRRVEQELFGIDTRSPSYRTCERAGERDG
jgi:hypothetical protein